MGSRTCMWWRNCSLFRTDKLMQLKTLKEIIRKKENKSEFAIVTNLATGNSEIFEKGKSLSKGFEKFMDQINTFYKSKKNGIIEDTNIFVESYIRPIRVIIVGSVHIAQYLVDFANSLNFEIFIIDPREYFASKQRFPGMEIINHLKKLNLKFRMKAHGKLGLLVVVRLQFI